MAYYRAIGTGGAPQPQQIYLYNQGVDNTALTGGLVSAGYSFASGWTNNGTVIFQSNYIETEIGSDANSTVVQVGTTVKVDLTNYKSIVVRAHDVDGNQLVGTVDISSISGSYYVSVSNYIPSSRVKSFRIDVSSSKQYTDSTNNVAYSDPATYSNGWKVFYDSIELVSYNNDHKYLSILSSLANTQPSNTQDVDTAKRTFIKNSYVVGLSSNNYYHPAYISSVTKNGDYVTFNGYGGYGVGFVCNNNVVGGKVYEVNFAKTGTAGQLIAVFYEEDGTYIGYATMGTNGGMFAVPSNAEYTILLTTAGGSSSNANTLKLNSITQINQQGTVTPIEPTYLYKEGVDNTDLTGGLTTQDYTFDTGTHSGTVTFDTTDIKMNTATANTKIIFGPTIPVNLSDYKSIIVKMHDYSAQSPIEQLMTLDISSVTGSSYIGVTLYYSNSGNKSMYLNCKDSKTNMNTSYSARAEVPYTSNTMAIDSIELIPVERKDIVKNGVLANGQTIMEGYLNNGSYNGGFTISGNSANFANSSSDAYINASLFLSEKVDFTEHKNLHFEGKSITNSGSIRSKAEYIAVTQASPSSGGYTNAKTVVQSMDNAFSLDVDIASLSGEYYILYGNGTRYNNINQTIEFDNVYVE